jgi:hypothetical protein
MAHAAIGQVFDLPVILSTSADTGPNGVRTLNTYTLAHRTQANIPQPLPKEFIEMYPNAPFIRRQGEVK